MNSDVELCVCVAEMEVAEMEVAEEEEGTTLHCFNNFSLQ